MGAPQNPGAMGMQLPNPFTPNAKPPRCKLCLRTMGSNQNVRDACSKSKTGSYSNHSLKSQNSENCALIMVRIVFIAVRLACRGTAAAVTTAKLKTSASAPTAARVVRMATRGSTVLIPSTVLPNIGKSPSLADACLAAFCAPNLCTSVF